MADEEDQKRFISMKKAMDSIRSPEIFMEIYNKDEFGQSGKVKPYKCQRGCGFSGGFYDVAKHERACTYGQQAQVPMRPMMPTVIRTAPTYLPANTVTNSIPQNTMIRAAQPQHIQGVSQPGNQFVRSGMPMTINAAQPAYGGGGPALNGFKQ